MNSFNYFLFGFLTGLGCFIILLTFWFLRKIRERKKINLSFNYVLLLVEIPNYSLVQFTSQEPKLKIIEEISNFENFLATLTKVKNPVIFEVALPHVGEEIFFFVAVSRKDLEYVKKMIKSFWPGSETIIYRTDYNVFNPDGYSLATLIKLKNHYYLPLKTYQQIAQSNIDPFDAFLGAYNKLSRVGEGLAYQLILQPVSSSVNKSIFEKVKALREGKKLEEVMQGSGWGDVFKKTVGEFFSPQAITETLIMPEKTKKEKEEELKPKPIEEITIKLLEQKATKPLFKVNIRLIASSFDELSAERILTSLESAFLQFNNPPFNEINLIKPKKNKLKKIFYEFAFRLFNEKEAVILNTEEIASIFHFPISYNKNPLIHWLKARSAPPPPNLPREGIILGKNNYEGLEVFVRIKRDDRRRHMYVIGQTGTGKTTLLKNMIEQDIKNGEGVCFIDPHGDVAQEILGLIPKERIDDVVYFNPPDTKQPIGFNILEYDKNRPEDKTRIINMIIEIIGKIYNLEMTGGPLFEQYLRNSLLLLMDNPDWGHTLLDVSRVFVDEGFREDLLSKCKNYPVVEFWREQATRAQRELSLDEMITWVTSKLNPFTTNDYIRPIICQPKSTIDFRDIMDNKKIFIANLPKGVLGETSAYIMGMLLITKILIAAFARGEIPESERKDFYLYIDEFQNFAFKGVASILAEARKYRLNMIFAHQYIKQVPEDIINAVFGNVGTIISFRVGPEDAEFLERKFAPVFSKFDFVNLPNYHAYISLLIDGYPSKPFSLQTIPPNKPNLQQIDLIAELSRVKYGTPKEEIEKFLETKYGYVI
ncbi:hypothetical protein HRbin35_00158 [bacterium HR35]|nr:hypothetical protein HRbin35_00158 [bacterium HR35]